MPPLSPQDVLERHPDCAWARVDDEVVVVQPDTGTVSVLSETGGDVWELLDGLACLGEVIDRLTADYDVEPEVAASDGVSFAAELVAQGLARRVDPGA